MIRAPRRLAYVAAATLLVFTGASDAASAAHAPRPATSGPARARRVARSTSYCYEGQASVIPGECGTWPDAASTPACAVDSGSDTCMCRAGVGPEDGCNTEAGSYGGGGSGGGYSLGFCQDQAVYVSKAAGTAAVEARTRTCSSMKKVASFATRAASGRAYEKYRGSWWKWWKCAGVFWDGYEWDDGKCLDSKRYLGEACGYSTDCQGPSGYDEAALACPSNGAEPNTCIPALKVESRAQCTCDWFKWHLGFACGSDTCNGHACVWNTGDGNRYCDNNAEDDFWAMADSVFGSGRD